MSSIVQFRSGHPLTPTASGDRSLAGPWVGGQRADYTGQDWRVSGRNRPDYKTQGYFNQAAFANTALGTFGSAGRNIIRGVGYANVDFMVAKNIAIREGIRVQFRSEYFNFFNRVNLGDPVLDVNNGNFGKIFSAGDPRILQFGLKFQF